MMVQAADRFLHSISPRVLTFLLFGNDVPQADSRGLLLRSIPIRQGQHLMVRPMVEFFGCGRKNSRLRNWNEALIYHGTG